MDLIAPIACRSLRTLTPLLPSVRAYLSPPSFSSSFSRLYARPLSGSAATSSAWYFRQPPRLRALHSLGSGTTALPVFPPRWQPKFPPQAFSLGSTRGTKHKVAQPSTRQKTSPAHKKTATATKEQPKTETPRAETSSKPELATFPSLQDRPLVLFEGPAKLSPTLTYLACTVFAGTACYLSYILNTLPSAPAPAPAPDAGMWQYLGASWGLAGYPLAALAFFLLGGMGAALKNMTTNNIVRMALHQKKGRYLVNITTATRPFVPRTITRKLEQSLWRLVANLNRWGSASAKKRLSQIEKFSISSRPFSKELTVPLEDVSRLSGSGRECGLIESVTDGRQYSEIQLLICGNMYVLCSSGGAEPQRAAYAPQAAGQGSLGTTLGITERIKAYTKGQGIQPGTRQHRHLQELSQQLEKERQGQTYFTERVMWWLRGKPQPPYFWSREAFDDLFPPPR